MFTDFSKITKFDDYETIVVIICANIVEINNNTIKK